MGELDGKTAIVTGASRGIGRAIALKFGELGANVVATARDTQALNKVVTELATEGSRGLAVTADLAVEEDIQRIADEALNEFGRIDVLVNNAAIIHPVLSLSEFDIGLWKQVIAVNLTAAAILTRAVLPSMMENSFGKVVNISSIGGRKGGKGRSAYRAAKAGLISLTESVAAEVKPFGIDVNCICPGGVATEGYRAAFGDEAADDPSMMDAEEIAEVAAFLVSSRGSAVTGAIIDAFGGTNPLFH